MGYICHKIAQVYNYHETGLIPSSAFFHAVANVHEYKISKFKQISV